MSEKEDSNKDQKDLNFSFQDILGDEQGNSSNSSFQSIVQTFRNENNQSASYKNLPAELQHLFDLPEPSYASPTIQPWSQNATHDGSAQSNTSTPNAPLSAPVQESASSPLNSENSSSAAPTFRDVVVKISPQSSPQMSVHSSPATQSTPQPASLQTTPQATPTQVSTPLAANASSQVMDTQSPSSRIQPSSQQTSQSPATNQPSPTQLKASPSPQTNIASSQPASGTATPVAMESPQQALAQKPQSSPGNVRSSPGAQQSPKAIAPQQPLQPQPPTTTSSTTTAQPPSGATSMTLLDNLTSQLSPDRKERFIELFRQLQGNAVTANEFLAQARMLLDEQQYQQLENLKSKPSAARNSAIRQPTQPQTMSSSQIRAEDTQRAMSGLM
ncbi:hypothetical protein BD408DRAFT_212067 [Parasitella parasitica]|nr:hypothetical protein BD408DRAFT_212067 [Parasitella parasitica]